MKKDKKYSNGFVFIETICALVIITLTLAVCLMSFSILTRKTKARTYYNQISDRYLLYSISKLGTSDSFSYANFNNVKITCGSLGAIFADSSKCTDFFNNDVSNLKSLYVVNFKEIDFNENYSEFKISDIENGTIEFLKTLSKKNESTGSYYKYLVGVFNRNNNTYYAALKIGEAG